MPSVELSSLDDLKKDVFEKRPDIKDEYEKEKPLRQLQKEIIKARIECDMSQSELAEKVGTTQSAISRLESEDDYNPNFKTLIRVSQALNKKLDISMV